MLKLRNVFGRKRVKLTFNYRIGKPFSEEIKTTSMVCLKKDAVEKANIAIDEFMDCGCEFVECVFENI